MVVNIRSIKMDKRKRVKDIIKTIKIKDDKITSIYPITNIQKKIHYRTGTIHYVGKLNFYDVYTSSYNFLNFKVQAKNISEMKIRILDKYGFRSDIINLKLTPIDLKIIKTNIGTMGYGHNSLKKLIKEEKDLYYILDGLIKKGILRKIKYKYLSDVNFYQLTDKGEILFHIYKQVSNHLLEEKNKNR